MLLDEVRAALQQEAELVPPGAVEPREVLLRARRSVRRRRVVRATATAAVLVVAIVGVIAISGTRGSPNRPRVLVSVTTTTAAAHASSAFTAAQLDAHDGEGVPAGWVPVDAGDARVFVPADWYYEGAGACISGGDVHAMASVGRLAGSCSDSAFPDTVSLIPSAAPPTGPVVETVHGYRVYSDQRRQDSAATFYAVPQLGVEIALQGAQQDRILATLAPSARLVAFAYANEAAPAGQTISTDGVRITIPSSWTVTTPDMQPCGWFESANGAAQLVRIRPGIGVPPCAPPAMLAQYILHDGVHLDTAATVLRSDGGPLSPLAVLHHGTTTIRVFATTPDLGVLDVYVQHEDAPTMHHIEIALGRDGRVAGGILASIEATS